MSRTGASLIRYFLPLFVFTCLFLCGCGGMNNNSSNPNPNNPQTTQVRVVDANGMMPSVNVVIGSTTVLNNVTFLTKTNFVSVPAGMQQLTLNGWLDPPNVSAPENFASGANMTLFFEGCGIFGESSFELLTDDLTPPAAGNFKLRIVDAAINGGGDLYVLPAGESPSGTPLISGLLMNSGVPATYHSFSAGTYHIVLTQLGNTTVQLDSGPISFGAGQNRTFVLFQDGGQSPPGVFFCGAAFKGMLVSDLN